MKFDKFNDFWTQWSNTWYSTTIKRGDQEIAVKDLCTIKADYGRILYERYNRIKSIVKESYFGGTTKKLSRYKRAAVIAYAVNGASPIVYKDDSIKPNLDPDFLKQRLAFHVATGSIILDYPKEDVAKLGGPLYYWKELGIKDIIDDEDDFLLSVYKDLFFAEVYENYNVLTMANVFGLLTERASKLADLTPISNQCTDD